MNFKLGEMGVIVQGMGAIIFDAGRAEGTPPRRLPSKASYWLNRLHSEVQKTFDTAAKKREQDRIALCGAYCNMDDAGKPIMLKVKNCPKCGAEYPGDAQVKDEKTGEMVEQTVCPACGEALTARTKYDIPAEKMPEFNEEYAKLQAEDVEFNLPWRPLPLDLFGDVQFSGEEMAILAPFIAEPDDMKAEPPADKPEEEKAE